MIGGDERRPVDGAEVRPDIDTVADRLHARSGDSVRTVLLCAGGLAAGLHYFGKAADGRSFRSHAISRHRRVT